MRRRRTASRIIALACLATVVAAVGLLLLRSGSSYVLHARFADAGQLVQGDLVEVAGRGVGTITHIGLTSDGLADVTMRISDGGYAPLHLGTRATIRAVGLSGVANRFVELSPGPPNTPAIPDRGILDTAHTQGIVDLDVLLDEVDPTVRAQFQGILRHGAATIAAPAGGELNLALGYLNPALSRTAALGRELVSDQAALEGLISGAATVSRTLAQRRTALGDSVTATAAVLEQLAARHAAVGDALGRAPAVLAQGTAVLAHLRQTLPAVDPALADLRPVAPRLARLLEQVVPVTRDALPTFAAVQALLPAAKRAMHPLPALAAEAIPALGSGTIALRGLLPILTGGRPYVPDLVAGLFSGFGGSTAGYYDANGHYSRVSFEGGEGGFSGLLTSPGSSVAPTLDGYTTGHLDRCPGGAVAPAGDHSNPFVADPTLCDPLQDQP